MNDKEQKAHDIALALASITQKAAIDSAIKSNTKDIYVDTESFYSNYKQAYDKIIDLIQEE